MNISDRIKIRFLLLKNISRWENNFIRTISKSEYITEKQKEKLNEIYTKIRFGRNKIFFIYEKYDNFEQSMMYNDIHDFDRD